MIHTAHVVMDPGRVSPSEALRELVASTPLVCITGRAMAELARELGGFEAATHHLAALANELERPIGINLPTVDDASHTVFLAPRSWSQERLTGFIGGHHEVLEDAFGEVSRVYRFGEERR